METYHHSSYPVFGTTADLIEPSELPSWVVLNTPDVLVFNKPGWVVCHPSKAGPWSSLAGAVREWTQSDRSHLVSRLDRETSGLVIFAKHRKSARALQMALQEQRVTKTYWVLLTGILTAPVKVDQPLGPHGLDPVVARVAVRNTGPRQSAVTVFTPLFSGNGYTLAEVRPLTGRKHQIRAHAEWLGHPVAGDKIYGGDSGLFLEFCSAGWTPRLAATLPLRRQALHAAEMDFLEGPRFRAPLAPDMASFAREVVGVPRNLLDRLTSADAAAPTAPDSALPDRDPADRALPSNESAGGVASPRPALPPCPESRKSLKQQARRETRAARAALAPDQLPTEMDGDQGD